MNREEIKNIFLQSSKEWVCNQYSLGIHFIATVSETSNQIISALIFLHPRPPELIDEFTLRVGNVVAGRYLNSTLSSDEIFRFIEEACNGLIALPELTIRLGGDSNFDYYSEIPLKGSGFFELNLLISGDKLTPESNAHNALLDEKLRLADPPFDGLSDLCSWLGLSDARTNAQSSGIKVRIGPPADISFEGTSVQNNYLKATILSHANFDHSKLDLAVREFPGNGIATRRRVAHLVKWSKPRKGGKIGTLNLRLVNANSALLMLLVGERSVRRRWFDDMEKAIHSRYIATQLFDKDLKQLKLSLTESSDSVRFEQGIASILFLMGFSSAIQVETQAPDLLVTTPNGRLAIIECTTKISDFQSKLGKLVDRKNALISKLESTGHNTQIAAFLVCGVPRTQIAFDEKALVKHQVTLLTRDELSQAIDQLRTPTSPDEMFDRAVARLSMNQRLLSD